VESAAPTRHDRDPQEGKRAHAQVAAQNGAVLLSDLGSSRGTWIGEARVDRPRPLQPGDTFRVGPDTVMVMAEATDGAEPPPPALQLLVREPGRAPRRFPLDGLVLRLHPVVLAHDTVLHAYHLSGGYDDFSRPSAEITRHPEDPAVWGLRNLTAGPWNAREPSGREWQVAPGRAVALSEGLTVGFTPGHAGLVRT
jgi:FHA domain